MTSSDSDPRQPDTSSERDAARRPVLLRVLLVEDEALIRISTADHLSDSGMTVIEAGSARQALAEAGGGDFDVLVTDVHLPDMSGVELAAALREKSPELPVIFATGDKDVLSDHGLPGTDLIVKPYDYDLLVRKIRSIAATNNFG